MGSGTEWSDGYFICVSYVIHVEKVRRVLNLRPMQG